MFIPAMTPRSSHAAESAPSAIAKYGAVMGTMQPGGVMQPAARANAQAATPVVQAATVQAKTEATNLRAVTRQQAPAQTNTAEKFEQAREILDQVRVRIEPGMREATIALTPAHLGKVGIKLELRDRELHAVVRAERPEALEALEKNLPELRAMLEDAGIDVGQFDFGLGFEGQNAPDFSDAPSGGASQAVEEAAPAQEKHSHQLASALARGGIDLIV